MVIHGSVVVLAVFVVHGVFKALTLQVDQQFTDPLNHKIRVSSEFVDLYFSSLRMTI